MTALLEVEKLRIELDRESGSAILVDDVSFAVEAGQILGIAGESGAGKSLIGASILGLLQSPTRQTAGTVRLAGKLLDTRSEKAMRRVRGSRIGAIFQDPMTALNPLLSVGAQLIETMHAHLDISRAEARERAVDWLHEVGIHDPKTRVDGYPHSFSGGMRQRIVIALALCASPQLVIADEPTTALDVRTQAQIVELLQRLARNHGTAIVLICHDLGILAQIADHVLVLYAGRTVESGATAQVLGSPCHPYSRGLINSIPMIGDSRGQLAQIEGTMPSATTRPPGCAFHPRCPDRFEPCDRWTPQLKEIACNPKDPMAETGRSLACWLHSGADREKDRDRRWLCSCG